MKNRTYVLKAMILVSAVAVLAGCGTGPEVKKTAAPETATVAQAAPMLHGKIKTVVAKSNTVSVDIPKQGVTVFKITPETKLEHAASLKDFVPGEEVKVSFHRSGAENIASVLAKDVAELPKGTTLIELKEMRELVARGPAAGKYVLFDSRPAARYHQGHIPGATMLPFAAMKKADEEGKLAAMLPPDKDTLLIFYCGGITCVLSPNSAKLAVKHGYGNVRIFAAGEPAWSKADYPLESSPKFVKEDNVLLIDLRSSEAFAAGHMERAVNIPFATFTTSYASEAKLPDYKGAALVFTSDKRADIDGALELVKDFGFTKATMFTGGMERWKKAGIPVATGARPAPERLTFVRILEPHEVGIEEFQKGLAGGSVLIVDARSASELGAGSFPGALNVPSEEAEQSFARIPRDRPVYIHCATGARAGMLYDVLKAKGYTNVKVLNANVEFSGGKAKITE